MQGSHSSEQIIDRRPGLNLLPQHAPILEQDEENQSSGLNVRNILNNFSHNDNKSDTSKLLSNLLEESDISDYAERVISKIDLNNMS